MPAGGDEGAGLRSGRLDAHGQGERKNRGGAQQGTAAQAGPSPRPGPTGGDTGDGSGVCRRSGEGMDRPWSGFRPAGEARVGAQRPEGWSSLRECDRGKSRREERAASSRSRGTRQDGPGGTSARRSLRSPLSPPLRGRGPGVRGFTWRAGVNGPSYVSWGARRSFQECVEAVWLLLLSTLAWRQLHRVDAQGVLRDHVPSVRDEVSGNRTAGSDVVSGVAASPKFSRVTRPAPAPPRPDVPGSPACRPRRNRSP